MTSSRKPPAGFWITVVLVAVLVGYPLSFGPACWIVSKTHVGAAAVTAIYSPIVMTVYRSRCAPLKNALHWYAELGAERFWCWATRSNRKVEWTGPPIEELLPGF